MTTAGEDIFWTNARAVLRDIGMQHLDLAHGAAVDTVRYCLAVRGRPTHHRQTLLEGESPTLLAYLERLASSADTVGWRTLEERIRLHAETLREAGMDPCAKPWLAAIWHCLPELVAIGQAVLDDMEEPKTVATFEVGAMPADTTSGNGGDDNGSAGKSGSAGTAAKPKPAPRLVLPVVPVVLTDAEKKALDLDKRSLDVDAKKNVTPDSNPEGPDGSDSPGSIRRGPK